MNEVNERISETIEMLLSIMGYMDLWENGGAADDQA